ncbi:MAG: lyase [Proteobacteria bacterium]|nr:lyase [Pseudomonadota bacterium]MBI3498873.1 lyase [Pseudomonadota bacterium]
MNSAWAAEVEAREYPLPPRTYVHDVAPSPEPGGPVWYTAQRDGALGKLDPATGKTEHIALGKGSAPHGVIIGPDGAPWVTDGGQNAIVRVDPKTNEVKVWRLPAGSREANLNTAAFDHQGRIWFTGQNGIYGRLDPKTGAMQVWEAPKGFGPYGITVTPKGEVYFASLAGSYVGRLDLETGAAEVLEPPTQEQGARRVWSDSKGGVWVSEWNAGNLSRYDTLTKQWKTYKLPGDKEHAYAVYVDDHDVVWVSDWGANAILRFDPSTEQFQAIPSTRSGANVRQIHGRSGEVWVPESGQGRIVLLRTGE